MAFKSARFTTELDFFARRRLDSASLDNPPFRFGETNSSAVAALQRGLIDLNDTSIAISDGPTGNYLSETRQAVIAFQTREQLAIDGEAGHFTLARLDTILSSRIPSDPSIQPSVPPEIEILPPPFPTVRSAWRILNVGNLDFSVLLVGATGGSITLQKTPAPQIFNVAFAAVGPGLSIDASSLIPGLGKLSEKLIAKEFGGKLAKLSRFFRDLIAAFLTGEPNLQQSLIPSTLPSLTFGGFADGSIVRTRNPSVELVLSEFTKPMVIINFSAGIGPASTGLNMFLFDVRADGSPQRAVGVIGDTGIGVGLPNAQVAVMFGTGIAV